MADFTLRGTKEMERRMRRLVDRSGDRAKGALRLEAEYIMTRSKRDFVPVDLGTLRSSGHVQEPVRRGKDVEVTMVYGGPAAPYALVQHENLDFSHRVGEAKYLERPLREAIPEMASRIAKRLDLEDGSI